MIETINKIACTDLFCCSILLMFTVYIFTNNLIVKVCNYLSFATTIFISFGGRPISLPAHWEQGPASIRSKC